MRTLAGYKPKTIQIPELCVETRKDNDFELVEPPKLFCCIRDLFEIMVLGLQPASVLTRLDSIIVPLNGFWKPRAP